MASPAPTLVSNGVYTLTPFPTGDAGELLLNNDLALNATFALYLQLVGGTLTGNLDLATHHLNFTGGGFIVTDASGGIALCDSSGGFASWNQGWSLSNNPITDVSSLGVNGASSLDGGAIYTDGNGTLTAATLISSDFQMYQYGASFEVYPSGDLNTQFLSSGNFIFNGGIASVLNTLDDGSGNMTVAANLTINSAGIDNGIKLNSNDPYGTPTIDITNDLGHVLQLNIGGSQYGGVADGAGFYFDNSNGFQFLQGCINGSSVAPPPAVLSIDPGGGVHTQFNTLDDGTAGDMSIIGTVNIGAYNSSIYDYGDGLNLNQASAGLGVFLYAAGGSDFGQLRICGNGSAWQDGLQTCYFQISTGSGNNATFLGGSAGSDAVLDRLQFCSTHTQVTNGFYNSIPTPYSTFAVVNNPYIDQFNNPTVDQVAFAINLNSGQTSNAIEINSTYNGTGGNLFKVDHLGNVSAHSLILPTSTMTPAHSATTSVAGSGTALFTTTQWAGTSGSTAYTVNDLVTILKTAGILKS